MDKLSEMLMLYNKYLKKSNENFSINKIKFTNENIDQKVDILNECLVKGILISEHPEYYVLYDLEPNELW